MRTLVDTRTMMVLTVFTDEGPVSYVPYKSDDDSDFGMPEYDYD